MPRDAAAMTACKQQSSVARISIPIGDGGSCGINKQCKHREQSKATSSTTCSHGYPLCNKPSSDDRETGAQSVTERTTKYDTNHILHHISAIPLSQSVILYRSINIT